MSFANSLIRARWFHLEYGLFLVISFAGACAPGNLYEDRPVQVAENAKNVNGSAAQDKKIEFKGISFMFPASLNALVIPDEEEAVPLRKETDKPDSVSPKHILFRLGGEYQKEFKGSFFTPELRIYPIKNYREQLEVSKDALAAFDSNLSDLQRVLDKKTIQQADGDIPFVRFIDAEQAFHAHTKFIDFNNGKGLLFLTQYNIESALINNRGLTYIFQGISSDGRYYVLGTFPVSVPSFPDNYETTKIGDYELPLKSFSEADQSEYENYLSTVYKKLAGLPSDGFEPSLTEFERIASSLKIDH